MVSHTRRGIYTPEDGDHTRLFDHWDEQNKSLELAISAALREALPMPDTVIYGDPPLPTSLPRIIGGRFTATGTNSDGQFQIPFPSAFRGICYAVVTNATTPGAFSGHIKIHQFFHTLLVGRAMTTATTPYVGPLSAGWIAAGWIDPPSS